MSSLADYPQALRAPDPAVVMRPVRVGDTPALRAACWPERDFETVYRFIMRARQAAAQGRGLGVTALDGEGQVTGYGQVTQWPRCAEISDLIVAPSRRGAGIGTALIQYLTRAARERQATCVEIGVQRDNTGALALYRRLGFKDSLTRELDLGHGPEEVLYLRLKLPPARSF
jgi:ribosomal protein S18 acetylase RimI-like enzyme